MDKTTFVFGVSPESEESKFVKFFSRLSLSLLISLLILFIFLGLYIGVIFLTKKVTGDIANKEATLKQIQELINKDPIKSNIASILDIDKRIKNANVLLDSHSSVRGILDLLQTYTLPNIYFKSLAFSSEKTKVAAAIMADFNSLKNKLKELIALMDNPETIRLLTEKLSAFEQVGGFPKSNIIQTLETDLALVENDKLKDFEQARALVGEIKSLITSLVQKLGIGEAVSLTGEAANFSVIAKQLVTYRNIPRKPFMSSDDKTVQKISVGNLSLTQEGRVNFKIDMVISPNYLLIK